MKAVSLESPGGTPYLFRHSGLTPRAGFSLFDTLFMPLDFCIEFYIDFRIDFGPLVWTKIRLFFKAFLNKCPSSVFGVTLGVFSSCVCASDALKSRFYYRKTAIFKVLHAFSKL